MSRYSWLLAGGLALALMLAFSSAEAQAHGGRGFYRYRAPIRYVRRPAVRYARPFPVAPRAYYSPYSRQRSYYGSPYGYYGSPYGYYGNPYGASGAALRYRSVTPYRSGFGGSVYFRF